MTSILIKNARVFTGMSSDCPSGMHILVRVPGKWQIYVAAMGSAPATSVLNDWNQIHDVPNVFVTDGACMTSQEIHSGPSLTYMALTARAANHAMGLVREGKL